MSIQVDPFSLKTMADPYPAYARLREQAPVYHTEPHGYWAVSRYQDVAFVLKNHQLFSSEVDYLRMIPPHADPELWARMAAVRGRSVIDVDPPAHTRLRKLVAGAFTPAALAALEPMIRRVTTERLGAILAKEDFDLVADVAEPVPVTVIAEMLGIDPARRADFKRWSDDLLELVQVVRRQNMGSERIATLVQSRKELAEHFQQLMAERRARPREDLVSALVRNEVEGQLTTVEALLMAVLMLMAGYATTTSLLASGTQLLLEHPAVLAELCADPALIPNFIEETLRFESPIPFVLRRTTAALTLSGTTIPRDQPVMAVLASANRDPAEFPDPDRFDPRRDTRAHVAFGYGIHLCVGAPLARLEGRIVFEEMLKRLPPFSRTTAQSDWMEETTLRVLRSLPLRFDRAAP